MAIRLHVEEPRTIPLTASGGGSVNLEHSEAYIHTISPTARVDQTENGAVVTITDKNGTTTAEISNGQTGPTGPQGPAGSDADVTAENIEEALGYVPADESDLNEKLDVDGTAYRTASIFMGKVDNTSTETEFTATIPGITELRAGVCVLLENGVINSKEGFTININGLGAKPVYSSMATATAETTQFSSNMTLLLIYDPARIEGGCWINYRGFYSDSNSIGYQIRRQNIRKPMSSYMARYRLVFTSADKTHLIPANNSASTNTTAKRDVCQEKIDPFGDIFYYSSSTVLQADDMPSNVATWLQYGISLGYSFNPTGGVLTLTAWKPVYIKAIPYADGSAIIDADEPYTQDLPITEDGKIYIHLGVAYNATQVELDLHHPIYYYHNGAVLPWFGPLSQ